MRWFLIAVFVVSVACRRPVATPPPQTPVVTTPSAGPVVRDPVARLDVHGGNGDGSIALWSLVIEFDVDNPGPEPVIVHAIRWEALTLGIDSERPAARVVEPGASLTVAADAYIAVDDLDTVRSAETLDVRLLVRWSERGKPEAEEQVTLKVPVQGF